MLRFEHVDLTMEYASGALLDLEGTVGRAFSMSCGTLPDAGG